MPDLLRHIHSDDPHMPWQWAASMFVMSMVPARPVPLTAPAQAHASPLTPVRVHFAAAYAPAQITLIAGVPLGPELPVLVISSTVGHWMIGWLSFTAPVRRVLIMATTIGALSAFFMVPVGAIFFVLEVPHTLGLEYYEVSQRREDCA